MVVDDSTLDESGSSNNNDDDSDIFEGSSLSGDHIEGESPTSPVIEDAISGSGGESDNNVENADDDSPVAETVADPELGVHDLNRSTTEPSSRMKMYHPTDQVIGELNEGVRTRHRHHNKINFVC